VERWLASGAVVANSGLVHIAALLLAALLTDEHHEEAVNASDRPDSRLHPRVESLALQVSPTDSCTDGARPTVQDERSSDARGGGFEWLLRTIAPARRERLGTALLELYALIGTSPLSTSACGLAEHLAWSPLHPAAALSVAELQIDVVTAAPAAASAAALQATSLLGGVSSLPPLVERLATIQSALRFTDTLAAEAAVAGGDVPAPRLQQLRAKCRLLLRVAWARARCEEAMGNAHASIAHLCECRALLLSSDAADAAVARLAAGTAGAQLMPAADGGTAVSHRALSEGPHASPVRPVPLILPPQAIERASIERAESRQTQLRLLQSALALLQPLRAHAGPCVRAIWPCEVRVRDQLADAEVRPTTELGTLPASLLLLSLLPILTLTLMDGLLLSLLCRAAPLPLRGGMGRCRQVRERVCNGAPRRRRRARNRGHAGLTSGRACASGHVDAFAARLLDWAVSAAPPRNLSVGDVNRRHPCPL
jgi:hypothetical protein